MVRLFVAMAAGTTFLLGSSVFAQDSAKVQVTIKISDKTPSFKGQRLVVMLYHDHPNQPDRGKSAVANHIDTKFSHRQGSETVVTVTLGENVKVKPSLNYSVNVAVFNEDKLTHISERKGARGPFGVLTNGSPAQIAVLIRPAD